LLWDDTTTLHIVIIVNYIIADIMGSGLDWNQTSAYLNWLTQLYVLINHR